MTQREKFEVFVKQCRPSWTLRRYAGGDYMDNRVDWAMKTYSAFLQRVTPNAGIS